LWPCVCVCVKRLARGPGIASVLRRSKENKGWLADLEIASLSQILGRMYDRAVWILSRILRFGPPFCLVILRYCVHVCALPFTSQPPPWSNERITAKRPKGTGKSPIVFRLREGIPKRRLPSFQLQIQIWGALTSLRSYTQQVVSVPRFLSRWLVSVTRPLDSYE